MNVHKGEPYPALIEQALAIEPEHLPEKNKAGYEDDNDCTSEAFIDFASLGF